jgi:hypothetical protein
MSASPSNQTIALMTVSVAATIGILYYWYSNRQRELAPAAPGYRGEQKGRALASSSLSPDSPSAAAPGSRSSSRGPSSGSDASAGASYPSDKTPKITNTKSAEKDLHLRIEELDKRGKALFKSGQVRAFDRID